MKKTTIFFVVIAFLTMLPQCIKAQTEEIHDKELHVYYFHSTHRCASCIAIENQTKAVVDKMKQDHNGAIKLHILNLDDDKNQDLIDKYEIWGSSLLIVKSNAGSKEEVVVLTQDGFSYARTQPEKFRRIITENIEKLLL